MTGIYMIYILTYPLLILPFLKKREKPAEALLSREDSEAVRGIAAIMVMLAHFQMFLGEKGVTPAVLKPFSVLGGMGVLIFFFLSGYGIQKGYSGRKAGLPFLKKRFMNVYLASVLVKAAMLPVNIVISGSVSLKDYLLYMLFGDWFIDVIMLQYAIYFISREIADKRGGESALAVTAALSAVTAAVFIFAGLEQRWYNGLMLFPAGMAAARYEKDILRISQKRRTAATAVLAGLFVLSGGIFTLFKAYLWADFFKTLAGILLSLTVCLVLTGLEIKSAPLIYLGRLSLYIYVIHVNLYRAFVTDDRLSCTAEIYAITAITLILSALAGKLAAAASLPKKERV